MSTPNFLASLFLPHEHTCFSEDRRSTRVYPVGAPLDKARFFSINPLYPDRDLDPDPNTRWHRSTRGRRADANVGVYRNILVEFDNIGPEEQDRLAREIPHTTRVHSGGKSQHLIISLSDSCKSRAEYDALVKRVYQAVGNSVVDQNCKNPSRFSRMPGVIRPDTGQPQRLLEIRGRVSRDDLESWLVSRGVYPASAQVAARVVSGNRGPAARSGHLNRWTRHFLRCGAPDGQFNPRLYRASMNAAEAGYTRDAWETLLLDSLPSHSLDETDLGTIASAFSRITRSAGK